MRAYKKFGRRSFIDKDAGIENMEITGWEQDVYDLGWMTISVLKKTGRG